MVEREFERVAHILAYHCGRTAERADKSDLHALGLGESGGRRKRKCHAAEH
jgi:hypothetical protein